MQFEQTWCQRADTPEHTPHCSGNGHHMADVVTVCAIPWETLQQWAHIPCMFNISMRSGNCSCTFVHSKATCYTMHFNSIHAVKWRLWGSNDSWLWRLPSPTIWCSTVWYKFQWAEDCNHLTPNGHFSSRTAPLTYRCCIFLFIQQIYILNILNMLHTLHFFLFKMSFISQCYLFWSLYHSHFNYRVC
jgi:hypothetical protein